ncbi:allantoicase-like protein [Thalassiosira pseudonana CCMP1335]
MTKPLNLTSSANNAHILFATDEWFAIAENILSPYPPTFVADLYCDQGKVMDGWETRRKRSAGHDWCVIMLGGGDGSGVGSFTIDSIDVDTAYFTGNQTPRISIEAMKVSPPSSSNSIHTNNNDYLYTWMPGAVSRLANNGGIRVLPRTPLKPGYEESRYHSFKIEEGVKHRLQELGGVTHLKLNYFPDGGVARLKVWGTKIHPHTSPNPPPSSTNYEHPELSSSVHGGVGLMCSNKHYGVPSNLLSPTLGKDMGDGWETARHPDRPPLIKKDPTGLQVTPLMDWSILKLGLGGAKANNGITRIIVDTRHFKGNFPESVCIDGCYADSAISDEDVCASAGKDTSTNSSVQWFPLLKRVALSADAEHEFLRDDGLIENGGKGVTHVRVSIYPDGGLSRVRIYGVPREVEAVPRSHL